MQDTAKKRYDELAKERDPVYRRAQECASLTVPALLPPEGHTEASELEGRYSGFGSRAVKALASKLLLSLYPPGLKSFRLTVPAAKLMAAGEDAVDGEMQQGLAKIESLVTSEIETRAWRRPTNLVLQLLIVTGNALEWMTKDNRIRVFRIDQYVVARDSAGDVIEVIALEKVSPKALPEAIREDLTGEELRQDELELYRWAKLSGEGEWAIHQELGERQLPGSMGTYSVRPFNALRWEAVPGEDYGRGKVEEHFDDFILLDALTKGLKDGAAMAARNIPAVDPEAGLAAYKRVMKAENGEPVRIKPDHVEMLNFASPTVLATVESLVNGLKRELAGAFLMAEASRRDAERVTAYELRLVIEALEETLGGIYSELSQEMQSARIERLMHQMEKQKALPDLGDNVKPIALTGLEALGREQDTSRAMQGLTFLQGLPPEVIQDTVDFSTLLRKAFVGLQLEDAIFSSDEAAQRRSQRLQQQAAVQALGQGAGAALTNAAQ